MQNPFSHNDAIVNLQIKGFTMNRSFSISPTIVCGLVKDSLHLEMPLFRKFAGNEP